MLPQRRRVNAILNLKLMRQESAGFRNRPALVSAAAPPAFFMERNGVQCAGAHLIVDLYGASRLDELAFIDSTLRQCVQVAGATLLHIHLHPFDPNGGVSGVAVLAESHISIHSWPEAGYAALDIFMCGKTRPERCVDVLLDAFSPQRVVVKEILRGLGT